MDWIGKNEKKFWIEKGKKKKKKQGLGLNWKNCNWIRTLLAIFPSSGLIFGLPKASEKLWGSSKVLLLNYCRWRNNVSLANKLNFVRDKPMARGDRWALPQLLSRANQGEQVYNRHWWCARYLCHVGWIGAIHRHRFIWKSHIHTSQLLKFRLLICMLLDKMSMLWKIFPQ